jgi:hypothetical protein
MHNSRACFVGLDVCLQDVKALAAERDESRSNERKLQSALDDAAKRIGRVKELETQWKSDMATYLATPFFASSESTRAKYAGRFLCSRRLPRLSAHVCAMMCLLVVFSPQSAVEEYLALRRMGFGHIASANAVVTFPGRQDEQAAQCLAP